MTNEIRPRRRRRRLRDADIVVAAQIDLVVRILLGILVDLELLGGQIGILLLVDLDLLLGSVIGRAAASI